MPIQLCTMRMDFRYARGEQHMIYYMTAFLLWANQAPNFWWAGFVFILIIDVMVRVYKGD